MPIKEIVINNNYYKIVCNEGQEDRLKELASRLDVRIKKLKDSLQGKCHETTLLVLIALDLEDKLLEEKKENISVIDHINNRINQLSEMFKEETTEHNMTE